MRFPLICLLPALLAGAFAAQPPAASSAQAERLVRAEAQAVRAMHEYVVGQRTDVREVTSKYTETRHTYLTTWVKRPNLVRIHLFPPNGKTIVYDGEGAWWYRDSDGVYWRQAETKPPAGLMSSAFPGLGRQLGNVNLPEVMQSARIAGHAVLAVGQRRFACTIVDVTVTPAAGDGILENNLVRLWISNRYHVPLEVKAAFDPPGGKRQAFTDIATRFEPNAALPASTWVFIPPKGSKPKPGTPVPGLE